MKKSKEVFEKCFGEIREELREMYSELFIGKGTEI